MHADIILYNDKLALPDQLIAAQLAEVIDSALPEAQSKIWHAHPVWFLAGNPVVGYSKLKKAMRLLFWSGQSFDEQGLEAEGSFKAAQAYFHHPSEIDLDALRRWLAKARDIQWDYKNLVRRKGKLERSP